MHFRLISTAIALAFSAGIAQAAKQDIIINFGEKKADSGINHLGQCSPISKANLISSTNASTSVSIAIVKGFSNINYSGTDSPLASLGFPGSITVDSCFGNVAEFQGITTPQSQVKLSGLNPQLSYSLTFFASRMQDGTESRETQYTAVGSSSMAAYLDPHNNTSNVALISNLKPDASGQINITVEKGPNNKNSYGFFYLGVMKVSSDDAVAATPTPTPVPTATPTPVPTATPVQGQSQIFKIDFGASDALSSGMNNLTSFGAGSTIAKMVDQNNVASNVSLSIVQAFGGMNPNGATNPNPQLGLPASATRDSFYGNDQVFDGKTNPQSQISISGLDSNRAYDFQFFASRIGASGDNRETQYSVQGSNQGIAYLNASENLSNVAQVNGIRPNGSGSILIEIKKGPRNNNSYGFFYMGVLTLSSGSGGVVTPTPSATPVATPVPTPVATPTPVPTPVVTPTPVITPTPVPPGSGAPDANAGKMSLWIRSGPNYPEKFNYDSAVFLPKDYGTNPDQLYPMILSLHGLGGTVMDVNHTAVGGNKEGFVKQVWDTNLSQSFPAIVIAPSARMVGATADAWWNGGSLRDLIIAAKAKYKIDPKRIVVTGLSAGGDGTIQLLQSSTDLIAGFMPGAYNEDNIAKNPCAIANVPVWAFGNSSDGTFQPEDWQALATKVKACPNYTGKFTVSVYQNTCGHGCWDDHWVKPEVQLWLLNQSK